MSDRNEPASHRCGGMHRPNQHDGVVVLARFPKRYDGCTEGKELWMSSSVSLIFLCWPSMLSFSSRPQLMNAEQCRGQTHTFLSYVPLGVKSTLPG